jgi:hypothetical protein
LVRQLASWQHPWNHPDSTLTPHDITMPLT